jgi:hypothetical protein
MVMGMTKEERAVYFAGYCQANKERIIKQQTEYQTQRKKDDAVYRFRKNFSSMLSNYVRNGKKSLYLDNWLGCDRQTFLNHLESQFTDGMNWDNYGSYFTIDHIIPTSFLQKYEYASRGFNKMAKEILHYSNCRPLGKVDNIKKGAK